MNDLEMYLKSIAEACLVMNFNIIGENFVASLKDTLHNEQENNVIKSVRCVERGGIDNSVKVIVEDLSGVSRGILVSPAGVRGIEDIT